MMMNQLISIGYSKNKLMMKGLLEKLTSGVLVSRLWKLRGTGSKLGSLPDDILIEILSRIPAEQILRCRRICKHWYTLTSTPLFTKTHFKATTMSDNPAIVILFARSISTYPEPHIFLFDEWGEGIVTRKRNDKIKRVVIKPTCPKARRDSIDVHTMRFYKNGMLSFAADAPYLIRKTHALIVYNPITRQKLLLPNHMGSVCACFYHSAANENRMLFFHHASDVAMVEYRILSLDSLSCRRLSNYDLAPSSEPTGAIRTCYSNNEVLHWVSTEKKDRAPTTDCCRYFLTFDVNKEEFSSMPHPGNVCTADCNVHHKFFSFELRSGDESLLCLCDCSIQDQINMWVLEDHEKRNWVRRHSIFLDLTVYRSRPDHRDRRTIEPFGVVNGELLINLTRRGVFAYSFSTGTLRKIIEIVDGSIGFQGNRRDCVLYVGLIQKSLVSFPSFCLALPKAIPKS